LRSIIGVAPPLRGGGESAFGIHEWKGLVKARLLLEASKCRVRSPCLGLHFARGPLPFACTVPVIRIR
jgi:hypothetical protein